jgi:hypothetical protein
VVRIAIAVSVLLVLAPAVGRAQIPRIVEHQQRVEAVRRQLRSADPKDVAWGAFTAASYQLREVSAELAAALARLPSGGDQGAVISALLDAVIETRAPIPAETLDRYWEQWPVQTVFAFRDATGARDAVLLRRLSTSKGYQWFAAANLAVTSRLPGFASQLLRQVTLRLVVDVIDPPNDSGLLVLAPVTVGMDGMAIGDGIGQNTAAYPPRAEYRFAGTAVTPLTGDALSGPVTVYYTRQLHDEFQFGTASYEIGGPSDVDRLRYLAHMSRGGIRAAWPATSSESVTWRGSEDFRQRVDAAKETIRRRYRTLIADLLATSALTSAEAEPFGEPSVDVDVRDKRSSPSTPLPSLAPTR